MARVGRTALVIAAAIVLAPAGAEAQQDMSAGDSARMVDMADHAMSAGPMEDVVRTLSHADPADLDAIAVYITGVMGAPDAARQGRESASRRKASQENVRPANRAFAKLEANSSSCARLS